MNDCTSGSCETGQHTPHSDNGLRKTCWTHGVVIEIWEMIFSAIRLSPYIYTYSFTQRPKTPLLGLPPLVVPQVCSHWRTIAKGYPWLWTSLEVDISETSYNFAVPLESYLVNSMDNPLQIRIAGDPTYVSPWGVDIWTTLSRHIHKSQELTLAFVNRGEVDHLPPVQQLTFPHLEHYQEQMVPGYIPSWPWFWQAIREAPKLVRLSSQCCRATIVPSRLKTWELRLFPTEVDEFLYTLRSCSNLDSLTLKCFMSEFDDPLVTVASGAVKLPSLQSISIWVDPYCRNWSSKIINSLNAPVLEFCQIIMSSLTSSSLGLIQRSSSSLKQIRVQLQSPFGSAHLLKPLFKALKSTSQLIDFAFYFNAEYASSHIGDYRSLVNDVVFTFLLKLGDAHHFLPNIRRISLRLPFVKFNAKLVEQVLRVVSVRQLTPHPLMEFYLACLYFEGENEGEFVMGAEMIERVRILEENGIKVAVEEERITL